MNQYDTLRTTMTTLLLHPPAASSQTHIISSNLCSNTTYVTIRHADEFFEYYISRVIVNFTANMFSQGQNTRNANPLRELLSTIKLYMIQSKVTKCWLHEYLPTTLLNTNDTKRSAVSPTARVNKVLEYGK